MDIAPNMNTVEVMWLGDVCECDYLICVSTMLESSFCCCSPGCFPQMKLHLSKCDI